MPKQYWCTQCQKNHRSGKIYNDHWELRKKDEPDIPDDKLLIKTVDELFSFREIAVCQIRHLWRSMRKSNRNKLYIKEMNKVIMHERGEL